MMVIPIFSLVHTIQLVLFVSQSHQSTNTYHTMNHNTTHIIPQPITLRLLLQHYYTHYHQPHQTTTYHKTTHLITTPPSTICHITITSPPPPTTQPDTDVTHLAWNCQVQHILASTHAGNCVVWDLRKNDPIIKIRDSMSRVGGLCVCVCHNNNNNKSASK